MSNGDFNIPIAPTSVPFRPGGGTRERAPLKRTVVHEGTVQASTSSDDAVKHMAKGAVLQAARKGEDRPANTAENGGNETRKQVDIDIAEKAGDRAPNPNASNILMLSELFEASTKIELAELIITRSTSRAAGPRPGQIRPRSSGTIFEAQYDSLYYTVKQDTQAVLRIVQPVPNKDRARNSPARPVGFTTLAETSEFLLQSGQEIDAEKFQLVETFDLPRIYFSGRRARVWNYSGLLINLENMQWKNRFLDMYDRSLRGSRCVRNRARVYLIYDDVLREGYILSASISPTVAQISTVPFSFTMFVTKARILVPLGDVQPLEETRAAEVSQDERDQDLAFAVVPANDLSLAAAQKVRKDPTASPFNRDTGALEQDATAHRFARRTPLPEPVT